MNSTRFFFVLLMLLAKCGFLYSNLNPRIETLPLIVPNLKELDDPCFPTVEISYVGNNQTLCNMCNDCNASGNCECRGVPVQATVTIDGEVHTNTIDGSWFFEWSVIGGSACYSENTNTLHPTFFFDICDPINIPGAQTGNATIQLKLIGYDCMQVPNQPKIIYSQCFIQYEICNVLPPIPPTPPVTSLPTSNPISSDHLDQINKFIALTFSPDLFQFGSYCPESSLAGNADRLVKRNFDGNWDQGDNWGSAISFINPGPNHLPKVYYTVKWTDDFWVVSYFFFFARDYANDAIICNFDEHGNDDFKLSYVIRRPKPYEIGIDPKDLLLGMRVNHHEKPPTTMDCVDDFRINSVTSPSPTNPTIGAHPIIFSSAGSHAGYFNMMDAFLDSNEGNINSLNPCNPKPVFVIRYTGGTTSSALADLLPSSGQFLNCLPFVNPSSSMLESYANMLINGAIDETYSLIDIYENTTDGPFLHSGFEFDTDPLAYIEGDYSSFDCSCKEPGSNCQNVYFFDDEYLYNPRSCDYGIWQKDVYFSGETEAIEVFVNPNNTIDGHPKSAEGIVTVAWTISGGNADQIICQGCDEMQRVVKFLPKIDPCSQHKKFDVMVTAVVRTIDCGDIVLTKNLSFGYAGPMNASVTLVENNRPCPCGYSGMYTAQVANGNGVPMKYNWSCLPCTFTSDINASSVFAKMVGDCSYAPDFTVSVSNGCGNVVATNNDIEPCPKLADGGGGTIGVSPNPTTNVTTITLSGFPVISGSNESTHVVISSQLSEVKFDQNIQSNEFQVDVSTWADGVYYIFATKAGTMVNQTFVKSPQ